MTDEAIMERIQTGEIRMMSQLFQRHQVALYNFFYQMNRDKGLSEDLTQNVFERMIKYRGSYESKVNFKSWMFRIARNVSNDHWRKKKIKHSSDLAHHENDLKADCEIRRMEGKEKWDILQNVMHQLEDETREIILLTRIEKLKYAEVAKMYNVTEGAIKVRVHRGLKQLKTLYNQSYIS